MAAIDSLHRAFIWSGEEKTSGAACMVAWDRVITPKHCGGLGVRNLRAQNQCLLLKLLHRLHSIGDSSWAAWVHEQADIPTMEGNLAGQHWDMLRELLSMYQALSTVEIGDGAMTSFWRDDWLPLGRLSDNLPALFSHCTKPSAAVRTVLADGVHAHLVPRLTRVAEDDLRRLEATLQQTQLTTAPDTRRSTLIGLDRKLRTAPIYQMIVASAPCPFAEFVWHNQTPPKVQFFTWLLSQDRIKSRVNLLTKRVVADATCKLCHGNTETSDHLIFRCDTAKGFWDAIGMDTTHASVERLWELRRPSPVPEKHYHTFLHLCCWQVWKHRNEVVFRSESPSL
ncbi:hypothetical protein PR202_gb04934 [Eleusine coracana subsp. coracana]|uniref:Reverse transcriptase zinc-binding domain-containing protein n=1 Tax=Eleusine coracana subsp. coracana TaxID=191504 RepID=A0AAV5E3A5_ELECO|nr:hypothetical protein PR202_gb04934 [Eleusine coracana subsp. coracana]